MRCEQDTYYNEQCERSGTWVKLDSRTGHDEAYCTQHANYYDPNERQRQAENTRWRKIKEAS